MHDGLCDDFYEKLTRDVMCRCFPSLKERRVPKDEDHSAIAPHQNLMSMGEVAADLAMTPRAIRLYESMGMINPRRLGPHRYFDAEDKRRLEIIKTAKNMGFSLQAIEAMLDGASASTERMAIPAEQAAQQLLTLQRESDRIEATVVELRQLLAAAGHPAPVEGSPEVALAPSAESLMRAARMKKKKMLASWG
jgi:DNA-binding transcriptional MerR regulator